MNLFVVLLGGKHSKARIEVHDIAFAFATDLDGAHAQLLAQWFGARKGVHIDAWMKVDGVDGFQVRSSDRPADPGSPKLYFIHLGGYDPVRFGEEHGYELIVAASSAEARSKVKTRRPPLWSQPHTDAVVEIDACEPIEKVGDSFLHLIAGPYEPTRWSNTYQVIS